MNINYLSDFIDRFPNVFLSHTLKLSDITATKAIRLDDQQMLNSDDPFPNKFELEVIRFWRKRKLLPFFEEGKHAKISPSQLMWLRFLENLRNLSPNTAVLEAAHEFFLKRAYDNNLALKNYIALQDSLQDELVKNPNNEIARWKLDHLRSIFNDPLLMYSVKIDMNYFNMNIMEEVINSPEVKTIFTFKMGKKVLDESGTVADVPVFEIIQNEIVIDGNNHQNGENNKYFNLYNSPVSIFPASFFLKDVFYDCSISENAFNIQILEKSEKTVFKNIKEKKLGTVTFYLGDEIDPKIYSLQGIDNGYNIESIKEIKFKMCTKKYDHGIALLKDGQIIKFNPNPNSELNKL
jgi:hypothetical protein